jgi:hypothetical protein
MNRGTVMSLNKRTAVVLTPDGQFVRVKRKAQFEVGEEIYDNIAVRSFPRVRQRLLQTGALASAILLVLFGFLIFRTPPVVAYVTMDINPSIELGLDAKERVQELRAVNEDAKTIVAGLKYRGQNLELVMNELARKLIDRHILTQDDGEIVIASVPVRAVEVQWETRVAEKMKQILSDATKRGNPDQQATLDVTTVFLPVEIRNEAEANGVSSGKMAFWLVSKSQGHELTLETLKSQSLKKIAASWGGVNKVMSKYEQKNEVNDDKENANSHDDKKDTPTPSNNIDDKGNMDNKGNKNDKVNKQVGSNKGNVDNKKVDNKKVDNKKNGSKINLDGNKQIEQKKDVSLKIDDNINLTKDKINIDDNKKTWEQLLDEAKQKTKQGNGKSSKSDESNGSGGSDSNDSFKSSDTSENSDKKGDQ